MGTLTHAAAPASNPDAFDQQRGAQPGPLPATPITVRSMLGVHTIFAPPDGAQIGFNGGYSGIAVVRTRAHPIWSDTRNTAVVIAPRQGLVHDEDVFTENLDIPHP